MIMMMKTNILVPLAILFAVSVTISTAAPHHDDDRYSPLIRLLKQLRRRDRYSSSGRDDDTSNKGTDQPLSASGSSNNDQVVTSEFLGQRPQSPSSSSNNGNSNSNNQFQLDSFSSPEQIQKIIKQSQQQGSSSSSLGSLGSLGGSSGSGSSLYQPQGTSLPPQRIEQINRGVSTILNGVGSGSLERILRGSFMFTRNENVRSVANNVLDSIFGQRRDTPN